MGEPLSILSGVLGSYSACCEIFRQIQSIRTFHKDSEIQVDLLELQAYRVVSWGEGHNLRQKNISDPSKLLLIQKEKHFDKILGLFKDVKLLFDKYGVQYEDVSFPLTKDEDHSNATKNGSDFRSSSKAFLRKAMVPARRLQWGIIAKDELRSKCAGINSYVDCLYEVWPPVRAEPISIMTATETTRKLQEFLASIVGSQKPQQLAQIEFWLSLDNLRLNPHQDLENYVKKLVPDSCQWIGNNPDYKAWCCVNEEQQEASTLWIVGAPGYGKSCLCASIVQKLHLESPLLAFFFSTKHAQTGGSINYILRFWMLQLAEKNPEIRKLLLDFCGKEDASTRITNDDVWKLFRTILQKQSDMVLIVDGIDEYYRHGQASNHDDGHQEQDHFIAELLQCIGLGRNVRLLVVSRSIRTIRFTLPQGLALESSSQLRLSITKSDVIQDIKLLATNFIRNSFSKFTTMDQDKLIDEMTEFSQGSFLWIDSVKRRMKPNFKIGLLFKEMRNIPLDLREKYNKNLAVITQIDPYKALVMLTWILFAKQPVTIWEMCQVLSVQLDDLSFSIDHDAFPEPLDHEWVDDNIEPFCGDMIVIQDAHITDGDSWLGSATLSPLHPSVSDHLLPLLASDKGSNHQRSPVLGTPPESSAHLRIAEICFAWLINDDFDIELTVERPLTASRLKDYALKFWHVHLEEASDRDAFPLDLLLDFFQRENDQFIDWATHFEKRSLGESIVITGTPLYYAASLGLDKVVEAIIKNEPAQINLIGGSNGSPLMAALSNGRLTCFEQLLKAGAHPDYQTESGYVFLEAVRLRTAPFIELLLQYHANAKIEDEERSNALHILASSKDEKASDESRIFKILIKQGVDVNSKNAQGETPLILSSVNGHLELVKMILLCDGVDLDTTTLQNRSAIYEAVRWNQPVIFEMLFKAGADFITPLHNGFTPFIIACEDGYFQIAKMMISKVVETGHINTGAYNDTPILIAACCGHVGIVKMLLENNAEHMKPQDMGDTPLKVACQYGHFDVVQLFLDSCATKIDKKATSNTISGTLDPRIQPNGDGVTPLISAAQSGHGHIVKMLLQVENINILAVDKVGNSALHYAAAGGFVGIVRDLMDRIPLEDLPRHNRNNPLYRTLRNGHLEVAQILLEENFDVNISGYNKTRAIEILVKKGRCDILELLKVRWQDIFDAFWDHPSTNRLFLLAQNSPAYDDTSNLLLQMKAARKLDNDPDAMGWTPLAYASLCNNQQIAVTWLERFQGISDLVKIDYLNGESTPVLHVAASRGHTDLVELFILHGADPTFIEKKYGDTCLHAAIRSGQIKVVERVLTCFQQIDRLDMLNVAEQSGITPVHLAVVGNSPETLKLLLKWGANAACNTSVGTPIYQAASNGYQEILSILLAHLLSTNNIMHINEGITSGSVSVTPLGAAVFNNHVEITNDLIEAGASLSSTKNQDPIIHFAVEEGNWRIVEFLCARDPCSLSMKDSLGKTPLIIAARKGDIRMVHLLLNQSNKTISILDSEGRSGFHWAALEGHVRVLKLLFQHESSLLNMRDLYGATALSLAARWRQKEAVRALMELPGIDYDIKDIFDKDVIDWLIMSGTIETAMSIPKRDQLTLALSKWAKPRIELLLPYCDVCVFSFDTSNTRWHCKICNGDDFDICKPCRDRGAYCHNREHELEKVENRSEDEEDPKKNEKDPPSDEAKADEESSSDEETEVTANENSDWEFWSDED